jgi:hypothetical protein
MPRADAVEITLSLIDYDRLPSLLFLINQKLRKTATKGSWGEACISPEDNGEDARVTESQP